MIVYISEKMMMEVTGGRRAIGALKERLAQWSAEGEVGSWLQRVHCD
jgi:hypothetical protein